MKVKVRRRSEIWLYNDGELLHNSLYNVPRTTYNEWRLCGDKNRCTLYIVRSTIKYFVQFLLSKLKNNSMALLFSPLTLGSLTLRNRIVVSPMCEYCSYDGFANDWHLVHLGSRAVGGAGLIITEAAAVLPEGRITAQDLGIWKDDHIEFLKRITDFIKAQGCAVGIQLAHAGRKASTMVPWEGNGKVPEADGGWVPDAPSAVAFSDDYPMPVALDLAGIARVVKAFTLAAERALKAGFQVVEIHAAHGYLLHEFLSPFSNERVDDYGGSFENRIRLLLEVVAAVQTVWPADHPLFVRISATDWADGGWTIDDSVNLAAILKTKGVHLVDCSSGGNLSKVKYPVGPGYQVPFAEAVRKVGIPTGAVGMITGADQAESILQEGQADLVIIAREFLRNPYFPLHAARELGEDVAWPVQYERAKR